MDGWVVGFHRENSSLNIYSFCFAILKIVHLRVKQPTGFMPSHGGEDQVMTTRSFFTSEHLKLGSHPARERENTST